MNPRFYSSVLVASFLIINFQHCSVSGEGVGTLGNSSRSTSGTTTGGDTGDDGGGTDPLPPTVDTDLASIQLAANQVSFPLEGDCDTKGESSYTFELTYTPNGGTANTRQITSVCNNNRYNFAVTKSDLGMASPTPGTLSVRIILFLQSGDLSGNRADVAITWRNLTAHSQSCEISPSYLDSGDSNSASGTCTPPAGTIEVRMNYVMDDYGTIIVNGNTVVNHPLECKIQRGDLVVTMTPGVANSVQLNARNCGMGGVGGRATFTFWGYW